MDAEIPADTPGTVPEPAHPDSMKELLYLTPVPSEETF